MKPKQKDYDGNKNAETYNQYDGRHKRIYLIIEGTERR
jgi:hypothetical protein